MGVIRCLLVSVVIFIAAARLQTVRAASTWQDEMRRHYDVAFRLQSAGQLAEADAEHRLFLAEALRHVANGRANIGEYARAVPIYEEAIQFASGDLTLHLEYAEAALDADDPARAKQLAQDALTLLPPAADQKRAKAVYLLARATWATGDRKHSIEEYKTAAALDPSFANICAVGTAYLSLSDKGSAARVFNQILAKFGDTAAIRMQLGRSYALAFDYPEAIQEFKAALAKDNRMPGLHYSLGAATMSASGAAAYSEAEAEFRRELAIHPDDRFSYPQLARIALARHSYKEAESDLIQANALDPGNPDTSLLSAQLFTEMNRSREAETALRDAIAATTDPSRHHYEIARAHYQLGRLLMQRGAKDEAKKEMQISEDLTAQSRLQDEFSLSGKPMVQSPLQKTHVPKAAEVAEETRFEGQLGPAIATSYDNLAVHAAINKNYPAAAAYFGYAAEWNPALNEIDNNWGHAAFAAGHYAEAAGALFRALEVHPEDAEIRAMLGISQYELQDYAKALSTLQPVGNNLDIDPLLSLAYADSMTRAGDFKQGLQLLETVAAKYPQNAAVHHALAEAYRKDALPQQAEREDQLADRFSKESPAVSDTTIAKHPI